MGGAVLWRVFGLVRLAAMAYRVWRHLRNPPPDDESEQQNADAGAGDGQRAHRPVPDTVLSRKEALGVLGLEDGASRDEIMTRYRELMQKNHPDRGGSSYLATLINAAKDKLLA